MTTTRTLLTALALTLALACAPATRARPPDRARQLAYEAALVSDAPGAPRTACGGSIDEVARLLDAGAAFDAAPCGPECWRFTLRIHALPDRVFTIVVDGDRAYAYGDG